MAMSVIGFSRQLAMPLHGRVIQGVLRIILHLTLIGRIPATIWAPYVTRERGA